MQVKVTGRGMGKTIRLIDRFMEDPSNSVIVVPDARQKEFVIHELETRFGNAGVKSKKWYEDHVITWEVRDRRLRGLKQRKILVDNLDMILAWEFRGHEVSVVTLTGDDE
jgi:hypothetical protein